MTKENLPSFDGTLIQSLTEEHKKIRTMYNNVMSAMLDKQYALIDDELRAFMSEIGSHYQTTGCQLYTHIGNYIHLKFPARESAFKQLTLEMKKIPIEIFSILTQSPNVPVSGQTYSEFMVEFLRVGKIMNERIIHEQTVVFKMYEKTQGSE